MENSEDNCNQTNLINELTQGRELAKQLQIHLNVASSSHEARELLVHKILNSYDKALSMLKCNEESQQQPGRALTGMLESPTYHSASPNSEDSDQEVKDPELRDQSRKRKAVPRWTQKVQVRPGTGLEGYLDDGYIWRKYGQKDILGAKYPRGYYRCTHRNVQGCLATKQVQRSDEDPTLFEITYRGRHTCNHKSNPTQPPPPPPPPSASPQTQDPNTPLTNPHEILLNFRSNLRVMTEDLETAPKNSPSFSFPSTSSLISENLVYSSPSMVNHSNFMGNYSPSFVSPATSGSSYMAGPSDIAPAAASATNSPTVSLDFPFGSLDQFGEPNFSFDNHGFFS